MHTAAVTAIAVDRDNRYLVTGSKDKSVRIWDLPTGRLMKVITPPAGDAHDGEIYALAVSPDGKTIACGGHTGRRTNDEQGGKTYYDVYIYDRESGDLLHKLPVPFIADALAYSKDGAFLAATSLDAFDSASMDFGADRVFRTHDYLWARQGFPSDGGAKALADFDERGRLVIIQQFGMWVISIRDQDATHSESRQVYGIPTSVSVSPDGSRIAIGFANSTVGVYSSEDLSLLYEPDVKGIGPAKPEFTDAMELAPAGFSTVGWSLDGASLYYAGGRTCAAGSCFVRKWSDGGRGSITDMPASRSRITRVVPLENGRLAYAAVDPAIGVLDADGKRVLFLANAKSWSGAAAESGVDEQEVSKGDGSAPEEEGPGQGCFISEPGRFPSATKAGKWGYIDASGKFAIPPQFDYAAPFSEGLAIVAPRRKLGFIDKSGRLVINPTFDPPVGDFHEGLAWVNDGDKFGWIDKTGEKAIPLQFRTAGDFSDGLALVSVPGKPGYGYVDTSGKIVIRPQFDDARSFSEGLAAVEKKDTWGYIDKTGATVIERRFDAAWEFAEGLARVREKPCTAGRCTEEYVDKAGKTVIRGVRPKYDGNFSDGLAMIGDQEHRTGFIDKSGKTVISPRLEQARPFAEGLAAVVKDARWGYIDQHGRTVIEPQFDEVGSFSEGLAEVSKNQKWGFIDKEGKIVIEPQFDDARAFSEGLAAVCVVTENLARFPAPSPASSSAAPVTPDAQEAAPSPSADRHTENLPQSASPALTQSQIKVLAELHQKVEALAQKRRYVEALPLARRALDLVEDAVDRDDPAVAQPLVDLARVNYALGEYRRAAGESALTMGEFREARSSYERAIAIRERNPGPRDAELIAALDEEGALLRAVGRYDEASDVFQRVLALRKQALGIDHPQTAKSIGDVAAVRVMNLSRGKRFVEAFAAAQAALEAAEPALGPDHPSVALALANLADLYRSFRASYVDAAATLHERALAIRERSLGSDHWEVVTSLRTLGEVYRTQKEFEKAEGVYARALRIEEAVLGRNHPALATLVQNLATFHRSLKHYAQADRLYRRALAMREKEGEAYRIAGVLAELGDLYRAQGLHAQAAPALVRALSLRERYLGPSHFTTAETLRSLGTVYRVAGAYARAEPLCERAVTIHQEQGHDAASWALRDRAALASAQHRYRSALGFLAQSVSAQESSFQTLFRPDSEEEQLRTIESRHVSGSYLFFLSLVSQHFKDDRQAVRDAMDLVLRRKGIVFEAQTSARASLGDQSEIARQKWNQLSAARSQLSALLLHKPPAIGEDDYRKQLSVLFEQTSTLESALDAVSSAAGLPSPQNVSVDRVKAALPAKSALVEFVKIPDFDYAKEDFDFPTRQWDSASRYLAFVLNPSGEVALVDLGPAKPLEAMVQLVIKDMRNTASGWSAHLEDLYSRLWAPLKRPLADVDTVVVSADGALNLVPFAALRDTGGRYLLQRYLLAYVSAGRELLTAERPHREPVTDLLLVANPAFDAAGTDSSLPDPFSRSRDLHQHFDPLRGTEREAAELPPLIAGTGEHTVLTGTKATEGAVKSARGPRILHLATHGFFLPDQGFETDGARHENSLVRSGLAFAGANRAAQTAEGDDGLLTALEVTGMDLSGTYLVVLSACDTGVGEVKTGEGVVGLRRAFALAGAENVMMSLWPVSDPVTADQMKRFYQNLQRMAPAEALREAQLQIIQELTTREGQAPPWLWAPFILEGGHAFGLPQVHSPHELPSSPEHRVSDAALDLRERGPDGTGAAP